MQYLATLFWFVLFFALWTPLSLLFRLIGGGKAFTARTAQRDSLWTTRANRSFRDMTRQG